MKKYWAILKQWANDAITVGSLQRRICHGLACIGTGFFVIFTASEFMVADWFGVFIGLLAMLGSAYITYCLQTEMMQ